MPTAGSVKRFILFFLPGALAALRCFSQPVPVPVPVSAARSLLGVVGTPRNQQVASAEICGNNIDDDGNGLIDDKDFSCYYQLQAINGCLPNKIIWASNEDGLYWGDPGTGVFHFVGPTGSTSMLDIAWASNGRLYGIDGRNILEIDPYTGNTQVVGALNSYYPANALTADAQGNLYMTALSPTSQLYLIKYSLITKQQTVIVYLNPLQAISAGDLTFLNGYLYMTCENNTVARFNPADGTMVAFPIQSGIPLLKYGLITLGDGYLYTTDLNNVYQMDPVTMQVNATPFFSFPFSNVRKAILGLSSYTEQCNGPSCHPGISVTILSAPPYCTPPGVVLQATGTGIVGASGFEWTLPGGVKATGNTLLATSISIYTVRYHNVPDDCGHDTSFTPNIMQSPHAYMGNDTLLCPGSTLQLAPLDPTGITNWRWQDGSTTPTYAVSSPGQYTLQVSNVCGVSTASVQVQAVMVPVVNIGADTEMCSFDSLLLKNALHREGFHYRWQNGSTASQLMAYGPGIYWVDVSTRCGTVRDSIVVLPKKHGCDIMLAMPNAFTPAGGSNALFRPVITGPLLQYEFRVYNRWGQQGFHTTNRMAGWDGKMGGSLQASGVYAWSCMYRFRGQEVMVQKGTVLLVR